MQRAVLRKDNGAHRFEFRDDDGIVRSVLTVTAFGEAFAITHPDWQRRGLFRKLVEKAESSGVAINFNIQKYTPSGWAAVRTFRDE